MKKKYSLLILLFVVMKSFAIDAVLFDGTGISSQFDRKIAMTIAGIVNREKPELYLLNVYTPWSYEKADREWMSIYERMGNVHFTKTIKTVKDLVSYYKSRIKGAIFYDPYKITGNFEGQRFYWQAEFAMMLAGLTDCIPFPNFYNKADFDISYPEEVDLIDHFNNNPTKKVKVNLADANCSWNDPTEKDQMKNYLTLLKWGISNLLSYTNNEKFYIREITDWTVQQRMFQVNLGGADDLKFETLESNKAEIIESIMSYMKESNPKKIFHVYGWMRPEPLVQWFSAWGGSFHETLLGNLSWHHIFPIDNSYQYQRASILEEDVILENKLYVVIVGTEGDAGNWTLGLQSGAWLSANRGSIPLAWGFNLQMLNEFPFVGQYYSKTATKNDGFVSVTTPLGYAYPDMYEEDVLNDAILNSKNLLDKYNIHTLYAYKHYNSKESSEYRGKTIKNNYDFNKLELFNRQIKVDMCMVMDPSLKTQSYYTNYGNLLFNHVNDGTFYGDVSKDYNLGNRILQKAKFKGHGPEFMIGGYQRLREDNFANRTDPSEADISLGKLKNEMEYVQANPTYGNIIEFVTPERITALMKKAAGLPSNIHNTFLQDFFYNIYINHNKLFISINNPIGSSFEISIYTADGRLISKINKKAESHSMEVIDIADYNSGLYLVNIVTNEAKLHTKFIKP